MVSRKVTEGRVLKQGITVLLIILLYFTSAPGVNAQSLKPDLNCTSAVLIDVSTGTVLYSKNPDLPIPPASLTKLVTLHLVYEEIAKGKLSKDEIVTVGKDADFRSLPPHSSLMFLEKGQRVSVLDLMKGLAVPSGNDAAIALADKIAGSVPVFVSMMNEEMKKMGFLAMHFEDASGLSEKNRITAGEFASFCALYIKKHPEAIKELHSLTNFTYPGKKNIPSGGKSTYGPITQKNRNNLLGRFRWADGLKTGYIDESGYNIAVTAAEGGRRLVGVLLGGPGKNVNDGSLSRAVDAVNLLSYGFYRFTNYKPNLTGFTSIRIYGGRKKNLKVYTAPAREITIPLELAYQPELLFSSGKSITAPVKKGDEVGKVDILLKGEKIASVPVFAAEDIGRGSVFGRIFDWIKLLYHRSGVSIKL